jgi:hypothetical protein
MKRYLPVVLMVCVLGNALSAAAQVPVRTGVAHTERYIGPAQPASGFIVDRKTKRTVRIAKIAQAIAAVALFAKAGKPR